MSIVIARGIGRLRSPMSNSAKSRIAIVDAQIKIHAVPRMPIPNGTLAAANQWLFVEGWVTIQGIRRNKGRKSNEAYSDKPAMLFHGTPQSNTQPIMAPPIKKTSRGLCIGEMRQLAKMTAPQAMRVEGANLRIRTLPEPQKSRNDITDSSLLACCYYVALFIIGHGDDAEAVLLE